MKSKGVKSTEFWLAVASSIIGAILASGAVSNELALQLLGAGSTILASLGYSAARAFTKSSEAKTNGLVAAAKIQEALKGKK